MKDESIKELKTTVEKINRDLTTARRERDSLADISAKLKSKIMDMEDKLAEYVDVDPVALAA